MFSKKKDKFTRATGAPYKEILLPSVYFGSQDTGHIPGGVDQTVTFGGPTKT